MEEGMKNKKQRSKTLKPIAADTLTDTLDAALTSAEEHLRKSLPNLKPHDLALGFEDHVRRHLNCELSNIAAHGHRNDDAEDVPLPIPEHLPHEQAAPAQVTAIGSLWSLYSDDDGVVLFSSESEALNAKKTWDEAGANGLAGPFEHRSEFTSEEIAVLRSALRFALDMGEETYFAF
jgi:hypothetical protein